MEGSADRPQWGVRDNGDGAQLGVSLAHARALSLLLRLFVSSILRFSEDVWFLHACKIGRLLPQSPLMGGPRVGATSNPLPGFERRVPWIYLSVGPRYLHQNRSPYAATVHYTVHPSAAAVRLDCSWTLTLCSAATTTRAPYPRDILAGPNRKFGRRSAASALCLSGTLSCFAVTHLVPPVCDRCPQTGEYLWLTPGRSLLLRLFVSSILRFSEDVGNTSVLLKISLSINPGRWIVQNTSASHA